MKSQEKSARLGAFFVAGRESGRQLRRHAAVKTEFAVRRLDQASLYLANLRHAAVDIGVIAITARQAQIALEMPRLGFQQRAVELRQVGIQVIHRGVGAITQNDVNLATVDKAVIIGFNVRPNRQVADLAEREGVEIKYYSIIYKAIEDIEASLKGMLKPEFEEVVTSHSEIREIFRSSKFGNIAGVMVQDGEVKRGTKCRILRNGIATVNDLEISSLRRFKDDVTSVKEGYEAGINLGSFNDIELGDIIETFEMREIERK